MPAAAVALALAAAVLHATWNVLLARAPQTAPASAVAMLAGTVLFLPVAIATWDVDASAIPYVAGSVLLELAYLALLAAAYDRAQLTVVYPIARGSAPVLVLLGSIALGASASASQAAGVLLVCGGVLALRGAGGAARTRDALLGLAVAVTIAGYTIVDDRGLQHAAPLAYLELVVGLSGIAFAGAVAARAGVGELRRAVAPAALVAGGAIFGAYGLTLLALDRAPAAPVAALRETSVLIAVAIAALMLDEPVGPRKLAAAALVVAGVGLVAAG
jgi:drug/metabolite transporter (DMT)-like permease